VSNAVSIARRDKVKLLAVSAIGYHRQHILLSAFLTSQQSVRNISRPVASMRSRKGEVEEPNGQFGFLQHLFDKQSCSTGIASRPFRCALVQLVDRYARCWLLLLDMFRRAFTFHLPKQKSAKLVNEKCRIANSPFVS
jgi:hypothetical protein